MQKTKNISIPYTGGILQRLDTDVQRCDSDGADSNVTALTVTALGHQWL